MTKEQLFEKIDEIYSEWHGGELHIGQERENRIKEVLSQAINFTQCCKSDSELLVCKGKCDHGYNDEFGNELFCSIKEKTAN